MLINMQIDTQEDLEKALKKVNKLLDMGAITRDEWQAESERLASEYNHLIENKQSRQDEQPEENVDNKLVNRVVEELLPMISEEGKLRNLAEQKVEELKDVSTDNDIDEDITDLDMIDDGFLASREFWDNYLTDMNKTEILTRMTLEAVCDGNGVVKGMTLSELSEVLGTSSVTLSRGINSMKEDGLLTATNTKPRKYKLAQYNLQKGSKGAFVIPENIIPKLLDCKRKQIKVAMYIMCRNYHSPNYDQDTYNNLSRLAKVANTDSYDEAVRIAESLEGVLFEETTLHKSWKDRLMRRKGKYKLEYSFDYEALGFVDIDDKEKEELQCDRLYPKVKHILEKINVSLSWQNIKEGLELLYDTSEYVRVELMKHCHKFKSKYNSLVYLRWMIKQAEQGRLCYIE